MTTKSAIEIAREALVSAKGCFDAAEVEGLSAILALQQGAAFWRLKDLVERRLMFAHEYIEQALSALSASQPVADEREAFDRVVDALPEFRRQDDYLLAHGASLMSEDSHEIIHVDTVREIIRAAIPAQAKHIGWDYLDDGRLVATYALPVPSQVAPKLYVEQQVDPKRPLARWIVKARELGYASIDDALDAAPVAQAESKDAERWRETLRHIGGGHTELGAQRFTLRYLSPVEGSDIMRGSVVEHFTAAIDAAIAASAQSAGGKEN